MNVNELDIQLVFFRVGIINMKTLKKLLIKKLIFSALYLYSKGFSYICF